MDKFARTVIATPGLRLGAGVSLREFLPRARLVLSEQKTFDDAGGVFHGFRRLVEFEKERGGKVDFYSPLISHSLGVYTLHRALVNAFPTNAKKQERVFEALHLKLTGSDAVSNDLTAEDLRHAASAFDDLRQSVLHDAIHDLAVAPEARAVAEDLLHVRSFPDASTVHSVARNLNDGKPPFHGLDRESVCSIASHIADFYSKHASLPELFRAHAENVGLFIHLYNNACLKYAGTLDLLARGRRVSSNPTLKKRPGLLKRLVNRFRRKK